MALSRRKQHILVEPTITAVAPTADGPPLAGAGAGGDIEWSVHRVLPRMVPDLKRVFPGVDAIDEVLVIPTFQKCRCDLIADGPGPDAEKDRLLETFVRWATAVCKQLREKGYWADLTDPCSGLPVLSERGGSFYPDVIGGQMLLNYDMIDTGCCKLLSHPKWQTSTYPATLFAAAPLEKVVTLLKSPTGTE